MARVLTVTSGKGGVGKTNISVNLAIYLAQQGHRICLFDADLGLANINILLGIYPEYTLKDVIDGTKALKEIIIHDQSGIDIIPGSSGVAMMESLSSIQLGGLASAFSELEEYDYFIFDTSAGVSKSVISFCMSASEVILIITPEPTSLTDAYALMKILSLNGYDKNTKVVVNQSKNSKTSQIAYKKLKDTTRKFLEIELSPLGTVVSDPRLNDAVSAQKPFLTLFPKTQASRCIKAIGDHLLDNSKEPLNTFALDTFWQKCVDLFSAPLKMPVRKEESTQKETTASDNPSRVSPIHEQQSPFVKDGDSEPHINEGFSRPTTKQTNKKASQDLSEERNNQLLVHLIEKLSSISEELSGIRKILEKTLDTSPFSTTGQATSGPPPLIPLDFEAFLIEQNTKDENDPV